MTNHNLKFVFREFKGDAFDALSETGCFDMLTDAFNAHVITLITIIEQQNRILRIDEQFKPLQDAGIFKYYERSRKFVAKDLLGVEIFNPNSAVILNQYRSITLEIGYAIENTLKMLHTQNPDFRYLLLIEGNVANTFDKRYNKDGIYGYKLSYERALAVYLLWQQSGINLRKYNTEVLLCGSGWNGLDRDVIEDYNKRFSIQIIPKVSSPKGF
jgi:hypothetical protein